MTERRSGTDRRHNHYFKNVEGLKTIDVYRVIQLFGVTDPCLQHALKKMLVAGGRGAGKPIHKDIQEAIDSLHRWQEMQGENAAVEEVQEYVAVTLPEVNPSLLGRQL